MQTCLVSQRAARVTRTVGLRARAVVALRHKTRAAIHAWPTYSEGSGQEVARRVDGEKLTEYASVPHELRTQDTQRSPGSRGASWIAPVESERRQDRVEREFKEQHFSLQSPTPCLSSRQADKSGPVTKKTDLVQCTEKTGTTLRECTLWSGLPFDPGPDCSCASRAARCYGPDCPQQ